MSLATMNAEPYEFEFDPHTTALIVIDMQRDFVEPGGFGEALGNDVTPVAGGDCAVQAHARRRARTGDDGHPYARGT